MLTTGDGVAALSLLERERPGLLLTDYMMPRLSAPGLALPVILMTATRVLGLPAGVALLHKPFDIDALLALVAALLPVTRAPRSPVCPPLAQVPVCPAAFLPKPFSLATLLDTVAARLPAP